MSIKDKIKICKTNREFQDSFDVQAITEINEEPIPYDCSSEYVVKVSIGTSFRANRAEYDLACESARRRLVHTLYRDQIEIWHELMQSIYSGDKRDAIEKMDKLYKSMAD